LHLHVHVWGGEASGRETLGTNTHACIMGRNSCARGAHRELRARSSAMRSVRNPTSVPRDAPHDAALRSPRSPAQCSLPESLGRASAHRTATQGQGWARRSRCAPRTPHLFPASWPDAVMRIPSRLEQ
jgi:hypothetical protein